ncbi:MAG TPA: lipoxygenase family protein [Kofleriaceae bacterium]|nr:lipoxygenase family protein [Kofleriaceae bacterium]
MSKVTVSGKVSYALPNSMGLGAGGGVKRAVIRIYDQDPTVAPAGLPGGFVNGTSGNDQLLVNTTDAHGEFNAVTGDWDTRKDVIVTPAVPAVPGPDVWVVDGSHLEDNVDPITHHKVPGRHPVVDGHWQHTTTPAVAQTTVRYPDALILTGTATIGSGPAIPLLPPLPVGNATWTFPPLPVPLPAPEAFVLPQDDNAPGRPQRRTERTFNYPWAMGFASLPWLAYCAEVPGTLHTGDPLATLLGAVSVLPTPSELPTPPYLGDRLAHIAKVTSNELHVKKQDAASPAPLTGFYQHAFVDLPAPSVTSALDSDTSFVNQRLAGVHPVMIQRAGAIPAGFHVTDQHLRAASGVATDTLQLAAADHRLYVLDYAILVGLPADPAGARHVPAPFVLFYLRDDAAAPQGKRLVPVAIQVDRAPPLQPIGPEVFTPQSGEWWALAKLMVQVADVNVHEMKAHLFETHMCMEPFAVAAFRELDYRHPVGQLLAEHFRDMILQMYVGRNSLLSPTGTPGAALSGASIDGIVGTGLDGSLTITNRAHQQWRFDQAGLKADLARRGLLDPATSIPDYPYRDDALLVSDAIEAYVKAYVFHYYASDAAVTADSELAAWRAAVVDPAQGNLAGVPAISTRATLIDVLTQIIFTCTAQHAAVNYPQFDAIGLVPNMPAAAYNTLPPLQRLATVPGQPIHFGHTQPPPARESFLPPKAAGLRQISLVANLGLWHYGRLGDYASFPFGLGHYKVTSDPAAHAMADQFKTALGAIETTIRNRNAQGRIPYETLLPSKIANSTNV